ncbi:hypothetical protein DM47_1871 [Burkholderia mallei]|nr:hypothetical protein DO73_4213 [Burkholderia pseudomallei]KGS61177.1 hypothetical protein X990_5468 [Burkholderia pseudomallei MSHR4868]KOS91959.1 hypothetical protein DM45_2468 [Burkholderia mallei]KGD15835.1 hypothetical protein DO70_3991 [Burkholderia pseudomallei]KGD23934.1 hypothetical protein DP42_4797 [Burkholderia pseudomallei]
MPPQRYGTPTRLIAWIEISSRPTLWSTKFGKPRGGAYARGVVIAMPDDERADLGGTLEQAASSEITRTDSERRNMRGGRTRCARQSYDNG